MIFTDFLAPFITVGLAELGDKTQIALVLLASKTDKRLQLLIGAFLGFLIVDGLAISFGAVISNTIPENIIRTASSLVFIFFGILMLRGGESEKMRDLMDGNAFKSSFLLITLTEMGDKTQIAAGLFATRYHPIGVLVGSMMALTLLSTMAILMGKFVSEKINPTVTGKIAGVIFIVLGILFLIV